MNSCFMLMCVIVGTVIQFIPGASSTESAECGTIFVSKSSCANYRAIKLASKPGLELEQCGDLCGKTPGCAGLMRGSNGNCYFVKAGCELRSVASFEYYNYVACKDGVLSDWSDFTSCSTSCGEGVQTRARECTPPGEGGKPCEGSLKETKKCELKSCAVNGGWSAWGGCSANCDGGYRYRRCNKPAPSNGGKQCSGINKQRCNTHQCPEQCRQASWWSSFDRAGWSNCGSSNEYLNGIFRNDHGNGNDDGLYRIEEGRCCRGSQSYGNERTVCSNGNWDSSFDRNYSWNLCPSGYFLQGFLRSGGHHLHNLEKGKCCKPASAPSSYGHCYDLDVSRSFDNKGTSKCNRGYSMVGMYRSSCDNLYCIEKFKCCQMKPKQ